LAVTAAMMEYVCASACGRQRARAALSAAAQVFKCTIQLRQRLRRPAWIR